MEAQLLQALRLCQFLGLQTRVPTLQAGSWRLLAECDRFAVLAIPPGRSPCQQRGFPNSLAVLVPLAPWRTWEQLAPDDVL